MTMLFDVKQFEHFFKERTLKKGLKLFEKGELEFIERQSGFDYLFTVADESLRAKKKGDKLLSYSCTCLNAAYCEHLAATLFYFQQEALGINVKKRITGSKKSSVRKVDSTLEHALRKIENSSLAKFIHDHKSDLNAADILSFLSDKSTLTLFDVYCLQFELILESYLLQKKLDQKNSETLTQEISALVKRSKKHSKKDRDLFYLELALVKSFIPLFAVRFTGDEKPVFKIYSVAIDHLNKAFKKGLNANEKTAWLRTTLTSIEGNSHLHSEAFLFFIPRFAIQSKSEPDLLLVNNSLRKRNYRITYANAFDKLLIARFEIALREWKLFKTALPLHTAHGEVELILAKAELFICSGESEKAFRLLEAQYDVVRTLHKNYYNDYLDYLLTLAEKEGRIDLEKKYLLESFTRRFFILPERLERYLELTPSTERESALDHLVSKIKNKRETYSFDKLALLLTKSKKFDALIEEIKREGNRFNLLHEIMIGKLPDYNERQLELYIKQFMEALTARKMNVYQEQLVDFSKTFIDRLPEKVRRKTVHSILDRIGGQSGLHKYISQVYETLLFEE